MKAVTTGHCLLPLTPCSGGDPGAGKGVGSVLMRFRSVEHPTMAYNGGGDGKLSFCQGKKEGRKWKD